MAERTIDNTIQATSKNTESQQFSHLVDEATSGKTVSSDDGETPRAGHRGTVASALKKAHHQFPDALRRLAE